MKPSYEKKLGKVTYNEQEIELTGGSEDLTTELDTQDGLLTNLETEINGLPEAGGGTGGSDEEVAVLKNKLKGVIDGTITELTAEDFEGVTVTRFYCFYGCKLEKVVMPEGVTELGFATFHQCTKITYCELPSTVTEINSRALLLSTSSSNSGVIRIKAQTPPTLTNARNQSSGSLPYNGNYTIEVPQGTLDTYLSDTNWITYDVDNGGTCTFVEYEEE